MKHAAPIVLALVLLPGCRASPDPGATSVEHEVVPVPGRRSITLARFPGGALSPFRIGVHEVTWAEFERFKKAEDWRDEVGEMMLWALERNPATKALVAPDRPAAGLGWHTAVAYCDWLSRETGWYFRLPTEREWEHALGGRPVALDDVAWLRGNSEATSHPPGKLKPNAAGLHDLLGNVWEYALEWRDAPFGPVLRGGAWDTGADDSPETARQPVRPEWNEEDPQRPHSLRWLFQVAPTQGLRVAAVAGPEDREERRRYAGRIEVRIVETGPEELYRIGKAKVHLHRVVGEVRNAGDRAVDDLEVEVHALTPQGRAHRTDREPFSWGRPTWMKAWPALSNGVAEAGRRRLEPGESRRFEAFVPMSFEEEGVVARGRFGARVTNLRFAR